MPSSIHYVTACASLRSLLVECREAWPASSTIVAIPSATPRSSPWKGTSTLSFTPSTTFTLEKSSPMTIRFAVSWQYVNIVNVPTPFSTVTRVCGHSCPVSVCLKQVTLVRSESMYCTVSHEYGSYTQTCHCVSDKTESRISVQIPRQTSILVSNCKHLSPAVCLSDVHCRTHPRCKRLSRCTSYALGYVLQSTSENLRVWHNLTACLNDTLSLLFTVE